MSQRQQDNSQTPELESPPTAGTLANTMTQRATGKVQHIWCSVTITKKFEDVFIGYILQQAQNKADISEYVVYLSTLGGSPFSAINLYTFMRSISQKTKVYNMGSVWSAGIPFFLGFKERIGVSECSFMLHQTWISKSILPEQLNVSELETQKTSLAVTDAKTQQIILNATTDFAEKKLTAAAIRAAFVKSTTYDALQAQRLGFISRIEAPRLPDSDVLYITDQYLATVAG